MNDQQPLIAPRIFTPPRKGEVIVCRDLNYYLGDQIGSGAFGAVYECTDDWDNKLVTKVILPQNRSYEQVREEWLNELQTLVHVRHPNITYIYDAFEYRDTFYIVVERCYFTLKELILLPALTPEIWLPYVARDILNGLEFIHGRGFIHKDLHPGNVYISQIWDRMVPQKDSVWAFKIGDLGISRLEGDIRLFNTLLAQWMVPPEFLDPVQFGNLDRHIDIYHTGLLLLGLLIKQIPTFTRDQILHGVPRQIAESLPSPYAPVIAKALRRHVNARMPSAIQMWREIRDVHMQELHKTNAVNLLPPG